MKDNLATSFRRALDSFREQARGEFATRLISDVLDPMANELDALSGEIEKQQRALNAAAEAMTKSSVLSATWTPASTAFPPTKSHVNRT